MIVKNIPNPPNSLQLFELTKRCPGFFWLDSAMTGALGRYSFLGWQPYRVVRQRGRRLDDCLDGRHRSRRANPFAALRELLPPVRTDAPELPTPFASGVVGFLGYELNRFVERIPRHARRDSTLPDIHLAFYDAVVTFDHLANVCWLTAYRPGATDDQNRATLDRMLHDIDTASALKSLDLDPDQLCIEPNSLRSNFTRDEYLAAVSRTIDYIAAGDIFQANLSQRFQARPSVPAHVLYRRLRRLNPAPFAAWLDLGGDCAVLSSSPERFLSLNGRRVETRPIKGTRPRTGIESHDSLMRSELLRSDKDNAELAMIVDLERNDFGRVSNYGSVKVTRPCALEAYASVYHLVATVVGELHPDKGLGDLLRATFPGGSITGAPKVRAMEIIDELEPTARSLYTGSIGWFDDRGGADLNIAIRTILFERDRLTFQVGGGIVADSVPEQEYQETLDKGRSLLHALGLAESELQIARGKP